MDIVGLPIVKAGGLLRHRGERLRRHRAAVITCLLQSAKLNGHAPYIHLKDVLERLLCQRASEIGEWQPHRWTPTA